MMSPSLLLAFVYVTGLVCLTLALVVMWLRNFAETQQFKRAGITLVLVLFVLDVVALSAVGLETIQKPLWLLALTSGISSVRIYACVAVGGLLALRLKNSYPSGSFAQAPIVREPMYGISAPSKEAIRYAILATAFMVAYSVILFRLSGPTIGEGIPNDGPLSQITPVSILILSSAAISEEIIFRLGIQTWLAYLWRSFRFGSYGSILVTTALWCAGHIGMLDPDWVKLVQIFVFGLTLGYLNRRFGVIPCIVTHVVFNIVMSMLGPSLVGVDGGA